MSVDLFGEAIEAPLPRNDAQGRAQAHQQWIEARKAEQAPYTPTPEEWAVYRWEQR